ncbi:MAG: DNA/RNA nuclease SfsA [Pseudomonadota bacterium]
MRLPELVSGTLLKRYKRFLADVALEDGTVIIAHCPNTGAMTGCAEPGSRVWLSRSDSGTRKYPHTWELVDTGAGIACVHSSKANAIAREGFENGVIEGFAGYDSRRSEVKYAGNSRIDLLLEGAAGRAFVEVKSVTLCRADGWGAFPDAVSDRGRKHILALQQVAADAETRAVLLFCVLHTGVSRVCAAGDIDTRYRDALETAMGRGVEVLAYRARIDTQAIALETELPFSLDPP